MRVAEVFFLVICDALMIATGYAGVIADPATDPVGVWVWFVYSDVLFLIIVVRLLQKLAEISKEDPDSAESKCFKFLAVWTVTIWTAYPVLYFITKMGWLYRDYEIIVYFVTDMLAKGARRRRRTRGRSRGSGRAAHHSLPRPASIPPRLLRMPAGMFGAIIVGSREALEGEHTPLALVAMAMTGIDPSIRRSDSLMDLEHAMGEFMKHHPDFMAKHPETAAAIARKDSLSRDSKAVITAAAKDSVAKRVAEAAAKDADPERGEAAQAAQPLAMTLPMRLPTPPMTPPAPRHSQRCWPARAASSHWSCRRSTAATLAAPPASARWAAASPAAPAGWPASAAPS